MEPDLYVFAGAPARVSGAHAGDHIVGPGQGEGGGERIPWRGKKTKPPPIRDTHWQYLSLLNGVKPLLKFLAITRFWSSGYWSA